MLALATPIIDWSAIWKICLVTLAAGAGVVVLFGFLLLGLKYVDAGRSASGGGSRIGGYALSAACGLLCVGVIGLGIYAMTKKPSSSPKPKPKTALVFKAPDA